MKKIIISLFILLISITAMAQTTIVKDKSCNFLKNLIFKNDIDTIIVKATYDGLFRSPDYTILKNLDKKKKLNYDEFGVDTGEIENSSSISFIPAHCSELYSGTISRKTFYTGYNNKMELDVNTLIKGEVIYLTCVVFQKEYKYTDGTPFFVIIDIFTEKPPVFN